MRLKLSYQVLLAALISMGSAQAFSATNYEIRLPAGVTADVVSDTLLNLSTATLPGANVSSTYTYDFGSLLLISGDVNPPQLSDISWSSEGTLPAGLSLSGSVLSGTPSVQASNSFTIIATDVNATDQKSYTLLVGGAVLTNVAQVSSGGAHTCAVLTNGTVKCWGQNAQGQLGDGTTTNRNKASLLVSGLSSVASVATGNNHSCALITNGTMKCWGWNGHGQIGDNSLGTNRLTPVTASSLSGVSSISLRSASSCVKLSNGTAKCWGYNADGQVGDGTSGTARAVPTLVAGLSGVSSVSASGAHTCSKLTNGSVKCWGRNDHGQIGDGTSGADKLSPSSVLGLTGVGSISMGASHSCAVLTSGSVKCWGYNWYGQVGDGTSGTDRLTPVSVTGLSAVSQLSSGNGHSCAMLSNGTLKCWGRNDSGQLGNDTAAHQSSPVDVIGLPNVNEVTTGDQHSCARQTDGTVHCWGNNGYGQVGSNTADTKHLTPIKVQK